MAIAWTVLGGSPAWPNPGQAASGYVIETDSQRVLVDCGSGVASELRARDPGPLTAIVISHFHADHWFDLVPLHYAYRFGSWHDRPRPSLHLPPGGRDVLDTVASVWDGSVETFDAAFDVSEYDPHAELEIGPMRLTFAPCLHYTTCYSIRFSVPGTTVVYSADTAPTQRLARFAHDADLFICEASLQRSESDSPERGHMDADEAAEAAQHANARRLLLTHVPEENDLEQVLERARRHFPGPIDISRPGLRYEL